MKKEYEAPMLFKVGSAAEDILTVSTGNDTDIDVSGLLN